MKNISKTDWKILSLLGLFILGLIFFVMWQKKKPKNILEEKIFKQISYYQENPELPIFITTQMCVTEEAKGFNCKWDLNDPYFYTNHFYDPKRDMWLLQLRSENGEIHNISSESVRISEVLLFDTAYQTNIHISEVLKRHPKGIFSQRVYFYIPINNKEIIILDDIGNQVTLDRLYMSPLYPGQYKNDKD